MKPISVAVLVSSDPSDLYFANQLIKNVNNVIGVFIEQQEEPLSTSKKLQVMRWLAVNPLALGKKIYDVAVQRYYAKKSREVMFAGFGSEGFNLYPTKNCQVVYTEGRRAINENRYVEMIKALQPDIIAVCGTSILKEPILRIPPLGVLNLHGGLAQIYRGVWTTLWAIYNETPEYVGFTVHYVFQGIDNGDIIYQGRPTIEADDNPETLYVKVVKLGTLSMIKAIIDVQEARVKAYPLKRKGQLYLSAMVTPTIIRKTWQKVKKGLIREYVKHPKEVELITASK